MLITNNKSINRSYFTRMLDYCFSSFISIGVFFIFLSLWQIANYYTSDFILANPQNVILKALEIIKNYDEFDLIISLKRAFIGSFISLCLGIVLGIISYKFKTFLLFIKPIISINLSIAPIAWVVLALFWFGFSDFSVIFVVIICTYAYTFSCTLNALNDIPKGLKDMAKIYKFSKKSLFINLYLPFSLAQLLPASLISISNAFKLTIMAELLGANNGIGSKIADARSFLENDVVLAYLLICVVFLAAFEFLIIKNLELIIYKDKTNV
ncbi:ABC transporter permease [Campylobacter canadensis]|uniref:ABC transporter permease subunit n=1 Tax=Campylobacter canadensis TaxID=449520 RepID=A0ABS7WPX7_9BACT|nr:ABC transporter permease subunit [Campylobacter canadensis]MBZ7986819.1 ABC transporter permease subunit [Campylobacter canadensis]MBZ7997856.1 ABC transporter permease subunit [Campylobacter canadensis]